MFGDPETNPMGWSNSLCLAEVAEIVSGITKGRKINGRSVRDVPYLAVSNVQDKHLNMDVVKRIEATEDEIERYRLRSGDLLLTEGGDPDKLGRGTLWNNELSEAIHQNHVFRVRLTSNKIIPEYLSWLVGSAYGKAYFLRQAKQTTGIAMINKGQLKAFPLLTPPVELQHQFAARLRTSLDAKAVHESSKYQLEALFLALQGQVFGVGQ
jgi:type I restriction enzyme S subunit